MSGANEPIIYAGAMVVAVLLMVLATSFSGAILDDAYSLMELNHLRYQSAVATHDVAAQNAYKLDPENDDFWSKIDDTGSNYCVYENGNQFSYLGENTSSVNFTEMRVVSSYTSDCNVDFDNLAGDSFGETINNLLDLSAYPVMWTSIGDVSKSEYIVTLPATLWE